MTGYHKSPLQLVQLQNIVSFNEIGQKVPEKFHSQKLGDNWKDGWRYGQPNLRPSLTVYTKHNEPVQ